MTAITPQRPAWRRLVGRAWPDPPGDDVRPYTVRSRLLGITTLAIAPMVLFASVVSIQHAYGAAGFAQAAAWMAAAALPILTGIAAILVVSLAVEALILRWLVYLERLARAYSKGRYSLRPLRFVSAPVEFRSLGTAVSEMATAVDERDRALRAAIEEQAVLLREVHHRVKNNLQIVGSLLSLQATRSPDQAVKHALADALVRIDAMGLSQRFMQPSEAEDEVSVRELFAAFVGQIKARLGMEPRRLHVDLEAEDAVIGLETASRLGLIAAEGVLQSFRRPLDTPLDLRIVVAVDDGRVRLILIAKGDPGAFEPTRDKISPSLIDGYVRQVRGLLDRTPTADGVLSVDAPL